MSDLSEKHPMLETFEDIEKEDRWWTCLDKLRKEYTMSFRQACQVLKCSRSWTSRYIKPNCHYIYLNQRYSKMAALVLKRESIESVWLNSCEFEKLIRDSIQLCSRQTVSIPVEYLIESKKMESFKVKYKRLDGLMDICRKHGDIDQLTRLMDQRDNLLMKSATQEGQAILKNQPVKIKRSTSKPVSCDVPDFELSQLKAVHDLKGYGDTDELIYRDLFVKGSYRLEIGIPDQDGVVSKKVYYLYGDDVDQTDFTWSVGRILIKYEDFVKYQTAFTR